MKNKRDGLLFDIVVTAVEGGVNYWAQVMDYRWSDDGEYYAFAHLQDCEDDKIYTLDFKLIRKGLALICNPKNRTPDMNPEILKAILAANRTNDAIDIDSECADVIVQVGLFGEIVYG
jgi:hypothetical protein